MITESCWSKETTKGTLLLIYLQSSLGQKASTRVHCCLPALLGSRGWLTGVVLSTLVSLARFTVWQDHFYFILPPTAELREFCPLFKCIRLVCYVGRPCPRPWGSRGGRRQQEGTSFHPLIYRWGRMVIGCPAHHACLREVSWLVLLRCSLKWKEIGL